LLQEVSHEPGRRPADEYLAGLLGSDAWFFPTLHRPGLDYGLAILTGCRVGSSGRAPVFTPSGVEPRVVCWVLTPDLGVATTHLSHRPRYLSRRQLLPALDSLPDAVSLLAGDVNHLPRRLLGRWTRLRNHGWRDAPTCPAGWPRRAIDHALTTDPSRVVATRVLPTRGSDHLPILVDLHQGPEWIAGTGLGGARSA
jgi:endonuclease/exonuclease/phosphatase family metal-dependent hydrolase